MAPSVTNENGHANGSTTLKFESFLNVINGKLVPASDGATRHGLNPATEKANAPVPVATKKDLDDAVEAGGAAFKKWANISVQERRDAVLKFADALQSYSEEFSQLLTMEQGKPVRAIMISVRTRWHRRTNREYSSCSLVLKFKPESNGFPISQNWICQRKSSKIMRTERLSFAIHHLVS